MPPHHRLTDADIVRIGEGVRDRILPKSEWTHAAHFAAAFWVIGHPELVAERDMPGLIRAYNEATGVANTDASGYHETITLASIRAARHWYGLTEHQFTRGEALEELLASDCGRSDWLLAHWTKPRLFSVEARRAWVEPDLAPLPF